MTEVKNIPTPEELAICEARAWESAMNPFGLYVNRSIRRLGRNWVPLPSDGFMDLLHQWQKRGITSFEPHYFPDWKFSPKSRYPGKGLPPYAEYWKSPIIKQGSYLNGLTMGGEDFRLSGSWIAIDTTPRMVQEDGVVILYSNDPMAPILKEIEQREAYFHTPDTNAIGRKSYEVQKAQIEPSTRTNLSRGLMQLYAVPAVAEFLEIPSAAVRVPRSIEYNLMYNQGYPGIFEGNRIAEWCHDSMVTGSEFGKGELPLIELGNGFTSKRGLIYDYNTGRNHTGFRLLVDSKYLER